MFRIQQASEAAVYSNVHERESYVVEELGCYCTPKVDQQGDSSLPCQQSKNRN